MPVHKHVQLGVIGDEPNSSTIRLTAQDDGNLVLYNSNGEPLWNTQTTDTDSSPIYRTSSLNQDGETGTSGEGQPFSIMPPYLAVNMWKRIS